MTDKPPVLELRGITKKFGPVVANDRVDFDLLPGEVHALLGENGAGKSTLMSVLYGLYSPTSGEILVDGKPVSINSPNDAIDLGIGMVHQHFMFIPVMTIAENIVLGNEPVKSGAARPMGILDRRTARKRVQELSDRYGLAVDPDARIEDVTVGMQQRVEILRALYRGARILVLDEPTAVLTVQEIAELMEVLRRLKADGTAIIFISHKLGEVLEIADRVTVLRRGKSMGTVPGAGATEQSLARMVVGREVIFRVDKQPANPQGPILTVEDLHVLDDRDLEAVRGASLTVRAGEIVAIAGVDGNGQHELVEAITGIRPPASGRIEVNGVDITGRGVRVASAAGVAHIAEDRHRVGSGAAVHAGREPRIARLSPRASEPPRMAQPRKLSPRSPSVCSAPSTCAAVLPIRPPPRSPAATSRSSASLARSTRTPKLLVAHQPTRGLDVGAIEFVHSQLIEQRDAGKAVLLVSLESEEVRSLADRIIVIYEGRIVAEFPPDATEEELGIAMTGGTVAAA